MMPWRQSQSTISGVLWPARLSHTRRIRSGGRSAGRLKRTANPSCHACHRARLAAGSSGAALAGSAATICPKASFSQPCRTVFVPLVAGRRLTRPVAGWNRVRILAVPARTYSCGWVAGRAPRARPRAAGWRGGPPAASCRPDAARSGRGRPRPRTRPPAPSEPPARRRARSAFFLGGVGVGDRDRAAPPAAAPDHAGVAPRAGLLPAQPGGTERAPDRVGADGRQTIPGPAQGGPQRAQRPRRGAVTVAVRDPRGLGQDAPLLIVGVADRGPAAVARQRRARPVPIEAGDPSRDGVTVAASDLSGRGHVALSVGDGEQRRGLRR